jgi:hypothetical protein
LEILIKYSARYNTVANQQVVETGARFATIRPMIRAYVFLGAVGSGRREVVADLLASAKEAGLELPAAVVLHENEKVSEADKSLEGRAVIMRWRIGENGVELPKFADDVKTAFVVLDGRADPVDQIERLAEFFRDSHDFELARIITVMHCRLLSEKPELKLWFDACVRFSDVVLLNRREGVPNKWVGDFTNRFSKKEFYPCLFGFVKSGRVDNPAEIMFPEARRMSLAFDVFDDMTEAESASRASLPEYEIVDESGDDETLIDEDEGDDVVEQEPFFARDAAGRRKIKLPDIADYV